MEQESAKKHNPVKKWHRLKIKPQKTPQFEYCDEYFFVKSVYMDVLIKKGIFQKSVQESNEKTKTNK